MARNYAEIRVGQSKFYPGADSACIKAAVSRAGKRRGAKFKTSKQRGGVRVWRLA